MAHKKLQIVSSFIFLLYVTAIAQPITFHHLNTSSGLSHNNVNGVTTDHNGFLWIATSNGLNLYDGSRVTQFHKEKNPELCSDIIRNLLCDSRNRIWVGSDEGVTIIDEHRRFHRLYLNDNKQNFSVRGIVEDRTHGIILLTGEGFFYFNEKNKKWELLPFSKELVKEDFTDFILFSPDTLLICSSFTKLIMIDLAREKILFAKNIRSASTSCRVSDSTIFLALSIGKIFIWNIRTQQIEKEFSTGTIENSNRGSTSINAVRVASNGNIIVSTGYGGIYIFNPVTKQFHQYLHEPENPHSLIANNLDNIHCEANGNVFIDTDEAGLTFFNVKDYAATNLPVFKNEKGKLFDNYINQITKHNNQFWIAAFDHLIKWNPDDNSSKFYHYPYEVKGVGVRNVEIKAVCIDKQGNVWAGTRGAGIGVLDTSTGKFKTYNDVYAGIDSAIRLSYIKHLLVDSHGSLWVATRDGVYKMETVSRKIETFISDTCLSQLLGKEVNIMYNDSSERIWFGTASNGAWCWNPAANTMHKYTTANKLPSNTCYAILESRNGTLYIGTSKGMSVLRNDSVIKNYNGTNGLLVDRCEGLLEDHDGNIWIGNDQCIICYDPGTKSFRYFDEKAGLNNYGYRELAYLKNDDGTLYWGSEKGLTYFQPEKLLQLNTNPNPIVYKLTISDSARLLTTAESIKLPYKDNNVTFHFASVNVTGSRNIFYQYILEGSDKNWTKNIDQHEVRYNALGPGNYTFRLKASSDGINWVDNRFSVNLKIIAPFWQSWWFLVPGCLLFIAVIYWLVLKRIRFIRHHAGLKQKIVETEMMALRAQMNPHFIFNCLSAIDNLIQTHQPDKATTYLARFARLIRSVLDSSKTNTVLFQKDFETLQLFLQLEQFRCNNKFSYEVKADEELLQSDYKVPPLIVQPFVENAIHHGLLNKQTGERKLTVFVGLQNDCIIYTITDNGVGRTRAQEIKKLNKPDQQSYGIHITTERIHLYNQNGKTNDVVITDLTENGNAAGTRVEIQLKIYDNI